MVVSEPPEEMTQDRWPATGLASVGLAPLQRVRVVDRFGYQVIRKVEGVGDRYPRRVGIPAKRPLF